MTVDARASSATNRTLPIAKTDEDGIPRDGVGARKTAGIGRIGFDIVFSLRRETLAGDRKKERERDRCVHLPTDRKRGGEVSVCLIH